MSPARVQRKRTKGWRMPENTIYVGRGSKWGNPYKLGETQIRIPALDGGEWEHEGRLHKTSGEKNFYCTGNDPHGMPVGVWHQIEDATLGQCIELFRVHITKWARVDPSELAGRDLACWCPLDQPCHADVLLEIANQP